MNTLQEKLLEFVSDCAELHDDCPHSFIRKEAAELVEFAKQEITVVRLLTYTGSRSRIEKMLKSRQVQDKTVLRILNEPVIITEQFIEEPIEAYSACADAIDPTRLSNAEITTRNCLTTDEVILKISSLEPEQHAALTQFLKESPLFPDFF